MKIRIPEYGETKLVRHFFLIPRRVGSCLYWLTWRRVRKEWWRSDDGGYTLPLLDNAWWRIMEVLDD